MARTCPPGARHPHIGGVHSQLHARHMDRKKDLKKDCKEDLDTKGGLLVLSPKCV